MKEKIRCNNLTRQKQAWSHLIMVYHSLQRTLNLLTQVNSILYSYLKVKMGPRIIKSYPQLEKGSSWNKAQ